MEFQFGIPALAIFGNGSSKKIGDMVKSFDAKTVFCVYDQGVKKAGIVDNILTALKNAEVKVVEYDDVLPNPPDTIVEAAAVKAKAANTDVLVAIGGGSTIDCAKAINILLTNPSPINQYDGLNLVNNPVKPLIAIPTTAGTASEVTGFSIVTDTTRLKKMVIGGQFVGASIALVDPELTLGLPYAITASTGMDALTHAIEAYVSKGASIPTDINALKAIELIYMYLPKAVEDGEDLEARTNMILGSMLAGYAFNTAVLGLVHSIAHPLSVHCGLAHGVANACGLPYVMEYNAVAVPEKVKDIAAAMGLDVQGLSPEAGAKAAVDAVKEFPQASKSVTHSESGF